MKYETSGATGGGVSLIGLSVDDKLFFSILKLSEGMVYFVFQGLIYFLLESQYVIAFSLAA